MASPYRWLCSSCLRKPPMFGNAFYPTLPPSSTSASLRIVAQNPQTVPLAPQQQYQVRHATSANAAKYKARKTERSGASKSKKKKTRSHYATPDLKDTVQFSLVDAMRYLRAVEVGQNPTSAKYEVHLKLKTPKSGAVVRNRLRLPHPIATDLRICVIAPPDSAAGKAASAAGASLVGEEHIFDMVKDGRIGFDRCICHQDSLSKLSKSGIARILGPRGLMPSAKTGTVVKDVSTTVKDMAGASEYRERLGVVRMGIGQLGFTPEEVQRNLRSFIDNVKRDMAGLSDTISKDIYEVVLSSTHGPGLSLNGEMRNSDASVPSRDLSTL